MKRVLFVCVGNICRSVFAEYLARSVFSNDIRFESAGIRPQSAPDWHTTDSLIVNFSIDASEHVPRDVRRLDLDKYDLVVALDPAAANQLKDMGVAASTLILWNVSDPWGGDLAEYERTALDVERRLRELHATGFDAPNEHSH